MSIEENKQNTPKSPELIELEQELQEFKEAREREEPTTSSEESKLDNEEELRNEKITKILNQLISNIENIRAKEKRLGELMELRKVLAIKEEQEKIVVEQNPEATKIPESMPALNEESIDVGSENIDTEQKEIAPESDTVASPQELETIEKDEKRKVTSADLSREFTRLKKEINEIPGWKLWRAFEVNSKSRKLEKIEERYNELVEEEKWEREYKLIKEEKGFLEIDTNASENIQNMLKIKDGFTQNRYKIDKLNKKLNILDTEIGKKRWWQSIRKLNREIKRLDERIHILELENKLLEENFNKEGRREFPLAYYVADRIQNPKIKESAFTSYGLRVKKNVQRPYTSMRLINSIYWPNSPIVNPLDEAEFGPYSINKERNDTTIKFNLYGFSMVITNQNEVESDEEGNFGIESSKPRYNVIDQNGRILIENVDYNNAEQIYDAATDKYKKEVEEEFNNLNKSNT